MADESYSSLREAINKIMGLPAGGTQAADQVVSLAPKASYSQDLQTTSDVSNTEFDPNAEANAANAAELAATKAENDALAASAAPAATTVAAAPSITLAATPPARSYQQQIQDQINNYNRSLAEQNARLNDPKGSYWMSAGQQRVQGQMGQPPSNAPWQEAQAYWSALANSKK